jgi:tetraacyldisaccharide 4'-kinase
LSLESSLVRCWYSRIGWCLTLIPLSLLFFLLAGLRRRLYAWGWWHSTRLPVPVIVVGNLTAGGTGKTPLVIWLAEMLRSHGYRPGVVSRGYRAGADGTSEVTPDGDPAVSGDEPVLLARRTGCPVWIGRRRVDAAKGLLTQHPEVNLIVADDGLQHYALARDIELVVIDGRRRFGNGWFLPAGPLREGGARLKQVDAAVINGEGRLDGLPCPEYRMTLAGQSFSNLQNPGLRQPACFFHGRIVHALAGIGNPERFFENLDRLGLDVVRHPFPDHHAYRQKDLPAGTTVMTEKDAVKCAPYAHADTWFFAVDARVSEGLEHQILNKLESRHGQQAA